MEGRGWRKSVKRSLKKKVGPAQWLSCNAFPAENYRYKTKGSKGSNVNLNVKIIDLSINGIWSETVVNKLLDALCAQHLALENAYTELEVERDAGADAIDDAMLMISQLQNDKSSLAMQHSQYYRETQQKMAVAQQMLSYYEDMLDKKNEQIRALQNEVRAYRQECLGSVSGDKLLPGTAGDVVCEDVHLGDYDVYNVSGYEDLVRNEYNSYCSSNFLTEAPYDQYHNSDFTGLESPMPLFQNNCKRKICSDTRGLGLNQRERAIEDLDTSNKQDNDRFEEMQQYKICRNGNDSAISKLDKMVESHHYKLLEVPTTKSDMKFDQGCNDAYGFQVIPHFLPHKDKIFSYFSEGEKCSSEELEEALQVYISSLRHGAKDRQGMLFTQLYDAALEAAKEEHALNCLRYRCEEDLYTQMSMQDYGFSDLKMLSTGVDSKFEELNMRICELENTNKSVKKAIAHIKHKQHHVRPLKNNAPNIVSMIFSLLASLGVAASAKDVLSKAFVRAWNVFSFVFLVGYKSVCRRS